MKFIQYIRYYCWGFSDWYSRCRDTIVKGLVGEKQVMNNITAGVNTPLAVIKG
jgi:hypothetical protein